MSREAPPRVDWREKPMVAGLAISIQYGTTTDVALAWVWDQIQAEAKRRLRAGRCVLSEPYDSAPVEQQAACSPRFLVARPAGGMRGAGRA